MIERGRQLWGWAVLAILFAGSGSAARGAVPEGAARLGGAVGAGTGERATRPGPEDPLEGWLEARPGERLDRVPAWARVVAAYDGRFFVELRSQEARALVADSGLRFRPVEAAHVLSVGEERFDVRGGEPAFPAEWRAGAVAGDVPRPYLIKFDAPIRPRWMRDVREAGATIVQYQPQFGLLVLVRPDAARRLRRLGHLDFAGEYHAAYKATRALRARAARDGRITLRVVCFDLPGVEARIHALAKGDARLVHVSRGDSTSQRASLRYAVYENVRTGDLPAILREPEVYWAEEWTPPIPDGERAAQIAAGNIVDDAPVPGYHAWLAALGADGSGVTVAVADTGLDTGDPATIHPDLAGRVGFATELCAVNRDRYGHGTNVASIAVGDPRLPAGTGLAGPDGYLWGAGAAPGASLYFQKALDPFDCGSLYNAEANTLAVDAVRNGGARIGNHSFTDSLGNGSYYNSQAQAWDARVRDADPEAPGDQPYMVIFSAGNNGPAAGSLTSPKAAKNIVTVGATENYFPGQCPGLKGCGGGADDVDALAAFSSRGPTADGRLKPDVVAPGHVVAGARAAQASFDCACDGGSGGVCCASAGVDGSNLYTVYSGTSQAAPQVAGASALVFDWYARRFGSFPSPAMAKALLIHGAVDMGAADAPNHDEGWGRIDLGRSLQEAVPTAYHDQETPIASTGDAAAFRAAYFVHDPRLPVEATLVWTDPPGAPACDPCLVNDLDLVATHGTTDWWGNNFADGFTTADPIPDTRNNVERIRLPGDAFDCSPVEFAVRAATLNGDGVPGNGIAADQDFALVLSNVSGTPGPAVLDALSVTLAGGCDADGFLDRRETADLTVEVTDRGCSGADGVEAVLQVAAGPPDVGPRVTPTSPQTFTIAPGQTVPLQWQLTLDDGADSLCNEPVTLRLDLTDGTSGAWSQTLDLTLDADAILPVTEVDTVDEDRSSSADVDWSVRSCRATSAPTSWHLGEADCSGIPDGPGLTRDLVFTFALGPDDVLRELRFRHVFEGLSDPTARDRIEVGIDAWDAGAFATLEAWEQGVDNPEEFTLAGPYDLAPYNEDRADTVRIRFRFTSGANWPQTWTRSAAGWDVDDIVLAWDAVDCDGGSCPACADPSGPGAATARDLLPCLDSGVEIGWAQDPGSWGDAGGGPRTYAVLRDGLPVASGPCSGTLPYGTTSCVDPTAGPGTAHQYRVRYDNGCGRSAPTSGAPATDAVASPPAMGGESLRVSRGDGTLTLTWEPQECAIRYNVYMGTLGNHWDHAIFSAPGLDGPDSCFEPSESVDLQDPGGDLYFLVAADNGTLESDLGASDPADPRPFAVPSCSPHE